MPKRILDGASGKLRFRGKLMYCSFIFRHSPIAYARKMAINSSVHAYFDMLLLRSVFCIKRSVTLKKVLIPKAMHTALFKLWFVALVSLLRRAMNCGTRITGQLRRPTTSLHTWPITWGIKGCLCLFKYHSP